MDSFIRVLRETQGARRPRLTDATRTEVKQSLAAGKTGAEIATAAGIYLPSSQAIKKSLGQVKPRKYGAWRALGLYQAISQATGCLMPASRVASRAPWAAASSHR